jgi:hypothetical protein
MFEGQGRLVSSGVASLWSNYGEGSVRLEPPWLLFRGRRLTSLGRIEDAYCDPGDPRTVRVLREKGFPVVLRLTNEEQARGLVEALHRTGAEAPATFCVPSPTGHWVELVLRAASVLFFMAIRRSPMVLLFLLPLSGLLAWILNNERIELGREGMLRPSVFGPRFIPYGAVQSVTVAQTFERVEVRLRGGQILQLRPPSSRPTDRRQLARTIARRIEEARSAFAQGKPDEGAAALLSPGGRGPGQWVKEMRTLTGTPRYREAAMDEDRLLSVVEDAAAQPVTRVGAALALSAMGEMPKARVRIAADACIDPVLKTALSRVAGDTEQDLEAAVKPIVRAR